MAYRRAKRVGRKEVSMEVGEIEFIRTSSGERYYGKFDVVEIPVVGMCLHWTHGHRQGDPWEYFVPVAQIELLGKKATPA